MPNKTTDGKHSGDHGKRAFKILGKIGAKIVAGTATVAGTLGAVTMCGTASTGTAISTLSGAAAKSATLAWLGGGSLAAGGFGMYLGNIVLIGISIVGVLLVGRLLRSRNTKRKNQ